MDVRLLLSVLVGLIGIYCLVVSLWLLRKRLGLRSYLVRLRRDPAVRVRVARVLLTEKQEKLANSSETREAVVQFLKSVAIIVLAALPLLGDVVPQLARQWAFTICILVLVAGLTAVLTNEAVLDAKLEREVRDGLAIIEEHSLHRTLGSASDVPETAETID